MPLVIKELHIKITINQPLQAPQATPVSPGNEEISVAGNAISSQGESEKKGDDNKNHTV